MQDRIEGQSWYAGTDKMLYLSISPSKDGLCFAIGACCLKESGLLYAV